MTRKSIKDVGCLYRKCIYSSRISRARYEYQFNLGDKYGKDTSKEFIEF